MNDEAQPPIRYGSRPMELWISRVLLGGVVLSAAIIVSLLVSLTMTPMMCSRLLKPRSARPPGRLARASEAAFEWVLGRYRTSLSWALRHSRFMMLLLAATVCLNVYLYVIVPKGFFPQQDTGRMIGSIQADQGISFQAMREKLSGFIQIVRADPAVESVVGFTGGSRRNSGFMFISLKPLAERKISAAQVVARLRPRLARVAGANLFLVPVQDIRIGGRQSNAEYQFTLQADDLDQLRTWAPQVRRELAREPKLADVNSDQQEKGLQTTLAIDRSTASRLGITAKMIDSTLNNAFGQAQVSTIYSSLNQYHVVMEVAPQYWQSPESLKSIYLLAPGNAQVPLSAISHYEQTTGPLAVNHQGQFAAETISFNLPLGVTLGDAVTAINDAMARIGTPTAIHGSFQGTARAFKASLDNQPWLILAALVTVYIVLGILYESYVHPITILSTLPSAGVGAILALMLSHNEFTIIALIGVILLIGIVKKNAIMMIDFALDAERRHGKPPEEAIYEACVLRFRPIMMTTMAAMLGALPLAIGSGYGAELRHPLGISIVGGLIVSQLLTLYTTPVVYLYLDRFRLWCKRVGSGRTAVAASEVR